MGTAERNAEIEALARMAARLAGRDPDEHLKLVLGEVTAFDDHIWRYPDFLNRAEAAYAVLDAPVAPDVVSSERRQDEDSASTRHERWAGSRRSPFDRSSSPTSQSIS